MPGSSTAVRPGQSSAPLGPPHELLHERAARPVVPSRIPRRDEESWWDRWHLLAAAVACWTFLLLAFAVDHLTAAPHVRNVRTSLVLHNSKYEAAVPLDLKLRG